LDDLHATQVLKLTYFSVNFDKKILNFRDTQETLAVIAALDNNILSEQEMACLFGWEDDYLSGNQTWWKKVKPQVWVLLDQPWSSKAALVWVHI